MKKHILNIILVFCIFALANSFNMVFASSDEAGLHSISTLTDKQIQDIQTKNDFETVISSFFLGVGDYAQDFLNHLFKEEITIDKIVYNKAVMLNANFFNNSINSSSSNASTIIREIITRWYEYFRKLALVIILMSLILVGIRYLIQTPESKVKGRDTFKKVVMAVVLVFFFPYVMRYAFDINEAIINYIASKYSTTDSIKTAAITQISDLALDEIEFRSPQYISLRGLSIGEGTSEATKLYLNRLETYRSNADMMRMMRAFAGVTLRFAYVIIWYILLAQVYIMTIIYIKRYLVIAFLIIIYPLVIIGYIIGGMFGKKQAAFNGWCGKFFTNIFMQSIHAIMYGTISGILLSQIRSQLDGTAQSLNVILMIVATSFLFSGEKLITRFWNMSIDTSERGGIKSLIGKPKRLLKNIRGK